MTDGNEIKVYYTMKFQKELKSATVKNSNVPDAIDDLIEALRLGRTGRIKPMEMPDKCRGFLILEDKCLNIEGAHSTGGGSRPYHTRYKNHILFLRYLPKNQKVKLDQKERKEICNNLQTVKNGTCQGTFRKVEKPLIRSIITDDEE